MSETGHLTNEQRTLFFKALADEKRQQIVSLLQNGEKCAFVLIQELNIPQPSLSYEMKILCESGITLARQDGKRTFYRLNPALPAMREDICCSLFGADPQCPQAEELNILHSLTLFTRLIRAKAARLTPGHSIGIDAESCHAEVRRFIDSLDLLEYWTSLRSNGFESRPVPTDISIAAYELNRTMIERTENAGITCNLRFINLRDPRVIIDRERVSAVLLHILDNAVRFTPAGGSVTLTVEQHGENRDGCGEYTFTVSDTGSGMDADFLPRCRFPFSKESDDTDGLGLGLTVAEEIVRRLGFSMKVDSLPGKGTDVSITGSLRTAEQEEMP